MKKGKNTGFTLIELLIAMAIGSIVILSAFILFNTQSRLKKNHEQVVEAQQNIRSAMFILERELKMAGYKGNTTGIDFGGTLGFVDTCNSTTLTFTFVADRDQDDNDGDDDQDENGELSTIQYTFFDEDGDGVPDTLGRSKDNDGRESIAENIEAIEFCYTLDDGSQATDPADVSRIRSVAISLLAKSRKPVNVNTHGHTYDTAGGKRWKSLNDGLFRRFALSHVICRNLTN